MNDVTVRRVLCLAVLLACLLAPTAALCNSTWPRFPTDGEIDSAKSAALAQCSDCRVVYTGEPTKYHFAGPVSDPVEVSGVFLAFAVQRGGGTITVNDQEVGTMASKTSYCFFQLYYDSDADEWYFGAMRRYKAGQFVPVIEVSAAAALAYSLKSQEDLERYVARQFEQPPDGFGHIPGWPAGAGGSTIPWEVVIGVGAGAAVLGAAIKIARAAAAARRAKSQQPAEPESGSEGDKDQKPDDDKPVGYILQLSATELEVSTSRPARLTATVWEVSGSGSPRQATSASLRVVLTAGASGIQFTPPAATGGRLDCTISLPQPVSVPTALLTVEAAAGTERHTAQVTLNLTAEYEMTFY
jgi:hypothetical protein